MEQLTFKQRRRNQLRVASAPISETGKPTVLPDLVDKPPVLVSVLEYMSKKNPVLNDLIKTLDLMEIGASYNIAATSSAVEPDLADTLCRLQKKGSNALEPLPSLPPLPALEVKNQSIVDRLHAIAISVFLEGNSYTREESVARIAQITSVTPERATKGLALMIEHQFVSLTLGGDYYSTSSTPF